MNISIKDKINNIRAKNKIGFMGHVIAGYPDIDSSYQAALGICEGGADFLEVQFPFSDPTADGPSIEGACYEALNKGFKITNGFNLVKKLADNTDTVILIMTYANIIFKYGIKKFIDDAKKNQAKGLIIPDIPFESDEGLTEYSKKNNIDNIFIAAPGSSPERIKNLSQKGSGFLYTVARRGITGKKSEINEESKEWFDTVKKNSVLPIAVGFGIRSKEQIDILKNYCDIAIAGSYFVDVIKETKSKNGNYKDSLKKAAEMLLK